MPLPNSHCSIAVTGELTTLQLATAVTSALQMSETQTPDKLERKVSVRRQCSQPYPIHLLYLLH